MGLTTADVEFTCEANGFHISSEPVTTSVPASFCAEGYDDIGSVKANLTLDFQGFMEDAAALFYFLWENSLQTALVEFKMGPTAPTFTGTVRVIRPPFDAIAGEVIQGSVTMPFIVGPDLVAPVLVAAGAAKSSE
jgi:hypothetical protein